MANLLLPVDEARRRGIPVALVMAGGYGREIEDTVLVHLNTIQVARAAARRSAGPRRRG
jgi:acetoin utilization deacetylase AcuC-like enzyme